jgi:DegV family protein with EDD domain
MEKRTIYLSYKVVIDSCGELLDEWKQDPRFESVALTLSVDGVNIIDDETFDQADFLKRVAECPECPKSACPSPERYMRAFDCEAEHVYAVTLSAELSGSYNSAVLGKNLLQEDHPDRQIHIFNSKSASVGQTLIAMKIQECEEAGLPFEQVIETVDAYIEQQHTFFVLDNLETLRKNGRLSKVKALVASALKIKPVMGSTEEGAICQLDQARGMNKALVKMAQAIVEKTADSGQKTLAISHCNCHERAILLKNALEERMPIKKIVILDTAGVSSMYANDGGVIVAV